MNRQRFCGALVLPILLLAGTLPGQAKAMVLGDFDSDCDVDLDDYATFQSCASGPAIPYADDCGKADFDHDGDVDQDDFGISVQRCYSGEGHPADPSCEQPCAEGACCPCGQTDCNGTCTNTATDNANCGTCGNVCAAGLTCRNGSCEDACPAGFAWCSGGCTNLDLDNANCGSCGNVCPDGYSCQGVCTPIDPSSYDGVAPSDFAIFLRCFSGAGSLADPDCVN